MSQSVRCRGSGKMPTGSLHVCDADYHCTRLELRRSQDCSVIEPMRQLFKWTCQEAEGEWGPGRINVAITRYAVRKKTRVKPKCNFLAVVIWNSQRWFLDLDATCIGIPRHTFEPHTHLCSYDQRRTLPASTAYSKHLNSLKRSQRMYWDSHTLVLVHLPHGLPCLRLSMSFSIICGCYITDYSIK